jgi:hypothetical protein
MRTSDPYPSPGSSVPSAVTGVTLMKFTLPLMRADSWTDTLMAASNGNNLPDGATHSGLQRPAVTGFGETLTVMLAWVGAAGEAVPPQDTAPTRIEPSAAMRNSTDKPQYISVSAG